MMRVLAVPVAAVLAVGSLAACGGEDGGGESEVASVSDGKPSRDGDGGAKRSNAEQAQRFVDCMRDNGVEMEDPDPKTGELSRPDVMPGGGTDIDKLRKAMRECRDEVPQDLRDRADRKPDAKQLKSMKKFAACMRDHGVAMEDPGPEGLDRDAILTDDPDFRDAMEKCRGKLTGAMGGPR